MKTNHTRLLFASVILALTASCALGEMFKAAEDPEIAALGVELNDLAMENLALLDEFEAAKMELENVRTRLAEDGLTVASSEAILAAMMNTTTRIGVVQAKMTENGQAIDEVQALIEEKETEDGVPWYVTLGSVLIAASMPTLNGIPIIGPLLSNSKVAEGLQKLGLRDEGKRRPKRVDV